MTKYKPFISPSKGVLSVAKMAEEISQFVGEDPGSFYRLVIGTDSHAKYANGHSECNFVTAIVIHRTGAGARYFWQKENIKGKVYLRDKIYKETLRSLDAAHNLVPTLRKSLEPSSYDLEIHIDVGDRGPTRQMIKEVVGMVAGNGFTAKTKPNSWGASSVADKHT